jgi:hypothetical protein
MKRLVTLCFLLLPLFTSQMRGATAAEIRLLRVEYEANQVRISITLSAAVIPNVITATGPDRLVLELPNTATSVRQRRAAVNRNGVQAVRVGLHQADPPVARVVVDLTGAHPYALANQGNTITLTVLPVTDARLQPATAAPASRSLLTRLLHPQRDSTAAMPGSATNAKPSVFLVVTPQSKQSQRMSFKVKYVAEGAAYLSGGRSAGLAEGMKLEVRESDPASRKTSPQGPVVAELQIVSVAETSAVTEVHSATRPLKPGDWAYLSTEDYTKLERNRSLRNRPVVALRPSDTNSILRNAGTPSSSPEGRIRGRIALDYSGIRSKGSTAGSSSQIGLSFRTDMTNIAGTHWNLQGYWRGRLTRKSQPMEQTLEDYLDKTYTLQLYYDNPDSPWVAGFGRLYLPWAVSLDTIDGGYFGRHFPHGATAGIFAGSTPNPASWHYDPNRRIAGSFVNFEGGNYNAFHYSSTSGMALSTLDWKLDRPYVFFENEVSYEKYISVYHSLIVDSPQGVSTGGLRPGAGISRSYLAVHLQPHPRISLDLYHNYFRDVPTAATQLIGTGLVDKLLYQGVNVGVHVELPRHVTVYSTIGQSDKTGDARRGLNQMYGLTWSEIAHTGLRADVHYSKFDSSFARGDYRVLSLSRHLGDRMLWDTQIGTQTLTSPFSVNHRSFFVDTSFDTNLGSHTFLQTGYTIEHGTQLNYDQWYVSLGYRFDVKEPGR